MRDLLLLIRTAAVSLLVAATLLIPDTLGAQETPPDNSSPEALVAALYDANSVNPGERHDWDRFRGLFAPGASMRIRTRDGSMRTLEIDEFITEATKQESRGFVERELTRRIEKYGHIAHAWSSYEAVLGTGETRQTTRGVNSFQLALVNSRWVIVSLLWETARSGGELPAELLPAGN